MVESFTEFRLYGRWARLATFSLLALVGTVGPVVVAWLFAPALINGLGPGGSVGGSWIAWLLVGIGAATSFVLWLLSLKFFSSAVWNLLRKKRAPAQESAQDTEQAIA